MMARNSTALRLFALCWAFALVLTSCSSDDSATPQDDSSSADAQKAYDEAKTNLVAQQDIDQAQAEFDIAKKEAEKAQAKADGMSKATRRNNKDPNNPQQAPDTSKAIQDAKTAKTVAQEKEQAHINLMTKAKQARNDLDRASAVLVAAKEREAKGPEKPTAQEGAESRTESPTESRTESPQTDSSQSYVSLLLVTISLLNLSLLVISFLALRKEINHLQKIEKAQFEVLRKRQDENLKLLSALPSEVTDVRTQLANLQGVVKNLIGQVAQVAQIEQPPPVSSRRIDYYPTAARYETPVEEKATLTFPISAGSILARLNGQEPTITLDALRNILVRDSDGKGELVLIQDPNAPYGLNYIVPNTPRLGAREDFYNHYKQFYECDLPKGGEVWVNKPGLVAQMGDGWQLREKGTLEIR